MSWQAAAFSILALVLAAGFVWYERSGPSSRTVALVAALAALAVAGRLVLAPIPNVVATTDVALITGYALGGAPGFVVGALAAPVSNLWLGQGPWTPWQMAGWGLAGLAGAALAAATGRQLVPTHANTARSGGVWTRLAARGGLADGPPSPSPTALASHAQPLARTGPYLREAALGRIGLAIACGLAGLGYGALLDLSVMVGYGGEQSLDRYLALSARGIPFNVAHAAGNVALALAAGPALVRMISRYRTRLEFDWRPAGALPALLAALVAVSVAASTPDAHADAADARGWLERAQRPDGGYGAYTDGPSSAQMTGWAMLGLEAAGRNPLDLDSGGHSPVDYLRTKADRLHRGLGDLELAILGLEGAGLDARRFAGHDLVAELLRFQGPDGSFQGQVNLTAYAILALRAAGRSSGVSSAAAWLREAQNGDGGWGASPSGRSDPDSTGSAMQGLAAAGRAPAIRRGTAYLKRTQKPGGGWGIYETGAVNSQSTAFAAMGLVAAGVDPDRVRRGGRSGLDFLAARQAADGHYTYASGSDQTPVWVTSQALLAVSREGLPIEPVSRSAGGATRPEPDIGAPSDPAGSPEPPGADEPEPAPGAAAPFGDPGRSREEASSPRSRADPGAEERPQDRGGRPVVAMAEPVAGTVDPGEGSREGGDTATWVAVGFGGLAAALGGGFLWYRRRLPG
jgi:energy-coupling factor transport system substrate-specific component